MGEKLRGETIHVVPLNDLKPHVESGRWCHCKPRIDGDVLIHNAYDGREFFEKDEDDNEVYGNS